MNAFENTSTRKDLAIIRARALAANMNDVADTIEANGADEQTVSKIRKEAEKILVDAGDAPSDLKFEHACPRCGGTGVVNRFKHVEGGRCFDCGGSGKTA